MKSQTIFFFLFVCISGFSQTIHVFSDQVEVYSDYTGNLNKLTFDSDSIRFHSSLNTTYSVSTNDVDKLNFTFLTTQGLLKSQIKVQAYPIPFKNELFIEIGESFSKGLVRIYTIEGKEVLLMKVDDNNVSTNLHLDTSHIDSGVYILVISKGHKIYSQRIIKY